MLRDEKIHPVNTPVNTRLHRKYVSIKTLHELTDMFISNQLLVPFINHLYALMKIDGVIQAIFDNLVPIDTNGKTILNPAETGATSGRLFDNLIISVDPVENDKNEFEVHEVKYGTKSPVIDISDKRVRFKKVNKKIEYIPLPEKVNKKIEYIPLPDMTVFEDFEASILMIFEDIIVRIEAEAKLKLTRIAQQDKKEAKKNKKTIENKSILSQSRYSMEDVVIESVIKDIVERACVSLKFTADSPWSKLMSSLAKQIKLDQERITEMEELYKPVTDQSDKSMIKEDFVRLKVEEKEHVIYFGTKQYMLNLEKFILEQIQFIFYMRMKAKHQQKNITILLNDGKISSQESTKSSKFSIFKKFTSSNGSTGFSDEAGSDLSTRSISPRKSSPRHFDSDEASKPGISNSDSMNSAIVSTTSTTCTTTTTSTASTSPTMLKRFQSS